VMEPESEPDEEEEDEAQSQSELVANQARDRQVGIRTLPQLLERASSEETTSRKKLEELMATGDEDDPVTILYTSGTSGVPKGVVLTHRSFLFQIERVPDRLPIERGQVVMSALPIWQSFERACEYIALASGGTIAYSKPMLRALFSDLRMYRPHYTTGVPRLWEGLQRSYQTELSGSSLRISTRLADSWARTRDKVAGRTPVWSREPGILSRLLLAPFAALVYLPGIAGRHIAYRKLRRRFGPRFVAGISGGGAVPGHTAQFFRAAGITLLEGYGLTETGPILALQDYFHPVTGTVGRLLPEVEFRIINETGGEAGIGEHGVLRVRCPSIMNGYYRNPELTSAVLDSGWLDTGDIVSRSRAGELAIIGRAKDTIILLGGENVEPEPIEEHLRRSPLIEDAMVVGQDRRYLAALIVVDPHEAARILKEHGQHDIYEDTSRVTPSRRKLAGSSLLHNRVRQDIAECISAGAGYRLHEQIYRFVLIPRTFRKPDELTHTGKKRRRVIEANFREDIRALYT
ncbi:MAG: AMP-dependent synthetase/ligase, partial [Spirochaetia bacterium]